MNFIKNKPNKRFSQHWLRDENILDQIIDAADINDRDNILEVGPGHGVLTKRLLLSQASAVHAIEIDSNLVNELNKRFRNEVRFNLVHGDVLDRSLNSFDNLNVTKVVSNIPYNITGPLINLFVGRLDQPIKPPYKRLVLLMQKEVAERIRALPGESNFSALSVRMQLLAHCKRVCSVSPHCFQPPPKVESEVICIDPLIEEERIEPAIAYQVELLLKQAFKSRRKMLRNTLTSSHDNSYLINIARDAGIKLDQRPQELAPESWVNFARLLIQKS